LTRYEPIIGKLDICTNRMYGYLKVRITTFKQHEHSVCYQITRICAAIKDKRCLNRTCVNAKWKKNTVAYCAGVLHQQ